MDELPELVQEQIQYEGKTYWAVPDYDPDIYENSCHGCKFKDMSLRNCQSAIGKPITKVYSTYCSGGDESESESESERGSVIWINKKYYSRYIKQRTLDRLEKST